MKTDQTVTLDRYIQFSFSTLFKRSLSNAYPWIVWVLASMFLFYKYLLQVSPSIMVNELMQYFHLSGEALGHLAAAYFYSYAIMQLPAGLLLDWINVRWLLAVAIAICALGGLLFGMSGSFSLAMLGRILVGLGGAFSAIGAMKLISLWFPPRQFALVSGLMMTVGMLGAVGGQAPLAYASAKFGWSHALIYCGIIGFIFAGLIALIIREKCDENDAKHRLTWKKIIHHLNVLLRNPQCWLISIYSGLAFAPISAFGGLWGVPFITLKLGITKTFSASLISLIFVGFACGCPLSGWLSDRFAKRKPLMYLGTSLGMICLVGIIYVSLTPFLAGLLMFLFGFFTSFFFISFAVIREINLIFIGGTAIGFINMFDAIFGAISEPAIGRVLDLFWDHSMQGGARMFNVADYQIGLILLPLAMFVAIILLFYVKETDCKPLQNVEDGTRVL